MDITTEQSHLKALYNQQNPKTCHQVSQLFELNYQTLLTLIPALKTTTRHSVIKHTQQNDLYLLVEETTPYTATFIFTHILSTGIQRLEIKVRIYFDAQLVEMICVCSKTVLNNQHPYLAQCSDMDIQWELNSFLERRLNYCLDNYQTKSWQTN